MRFESFPKQKLDPGTLASASVGHEAAAVSRYFSGRTIDDVTLDSLSSEYSHDPAACLSFLTPQAFALFLPAFMRIALEQYEEANAIPEVVISRLLHIADGTDIERKDVLVDSYSPAQKREVAEFLEAMSSKYWRHYPSDDAKRALNIFWYQFLEDEQ